jgi:hypothetical protein
MIPKTIDDVSATWLSEVLNVPVTAIVPEQIGQGVGLMGDIYRVKLTPQPENLPASVVVKLPSSFEENRAQGVALGMFDAEVRFYRELAPEANVGLPEIYHADIEPGSADFVIVMEDLADMAMVDQATGMNLAQATAAVKVLASIHAVWWDRVRTPELDWIPEMIGPRIAFVDEMLQQIYPVFAGQFGAELPAGGLELFERFAGNYLKVNKTLAARSPWTLAHQDYRVENIMFDPAGSDRVVVLDWQGIGRGPGAYDLAYILGGSMETELRREHEQALVKAYHDQLLAAGVSGYSDDQAWEDYGLAHLQGGLATSMVTGGSMDLSNERGRNLVATMSRRHVTAALDHIEAH